MIEAIYHAEPLVLCATLRDANNTRQAEWDTGGDIDLSYAGNELAGEVGEVVDAMHQPLPELADELADVVICCDLLARRIDKPLAAVAAVPVKPGSGFRLQGGINAMFKATGLACNVIKKLERERFGMPGSRATADDLSAHLDAIVAAVNEIASLCGINMQSAVARKFNKTSDKVGLRTRLVF